MLALELAAAPLHGARRRARRRSPRASGRGGAGRRGWRACRWSARARSSGRRAPAFTIFASSGARGRKSATAAAISSTSVAGNSARAAASSSAALVTSIDAHAVRALERDVRADERHLGSAAGGLLGERQAHAPRRAVAHVAHRVDRLARAAGRDQHPQPVERARRERRRLERRLDRGEHVGRVGQPAGAPLALRGQPPGARAGRSARRASAAGRGWPGSPGASTCGRSSPGASTSGAGLASAALVSRLSAWPPASLAIVLAEAGATQSTSQRRTSSRCEIAAWSGSGSPGKAPRAGSGSNSSTSTGRAGHALEGRLPDEASGWWASARRGRSGPRRGEAHELDRLVGGDAAGDAEEDPRHQISLPASGEPSRCCSESPRLAEAAGSAGCAPMAYR